MIKALSVALTISTLSTLFGAIGAYVDSGVNVFKEYTRLVLEVFLTVLVISWVLSYMMVLIGFY